jgi:hypothetical protein
LTSDSREVVNRDTAPSSPSRRLLQLSRCAMDKSSSIEQPELLGAAIELLIKGATNHFPLQRAMTWFQFKTWLQTDAKNTAAIFRRAALIFAALAINKQWEVKYNRLLARDRLLLSLSAPSLQPLIDRAFDRSSLYSLIMIRSTPHQNPARAKELGILDAFSEFRIRLKISGYEPSINNTALLLANSTGPTKRAERTSQPIERRWRERAAFLFAAREFEFASTFPSEVSKIFDATVREAGEIEGLKAYFAAAKSLATVLDPVAESTLGPFWPDLPIAKLPHLRLLNDDERNLAKEGRGYRRSAQTRKTKGGQTRRRAVAT